MSVQATLTGKTYKPSHAFQCRSCKRVFKNAQGLSGHVRLSPHCEPPPGAQLSQQPGGVIAALLLQEQVVPEEVPEEVELPSDFPSDAEPEEVPEEVPEGDLVLRTDAELKRKKNGELKLTRRARGQQCLTFSVDCFARSKI